MKTVLAALALASLMLQSQIAAAQRGEFDSVRILASQLEENFGARVGIAVMNTATGQIWSWRGNERFPMNSTFKAFACAALLSEHDAGDASLEARITIAPEHIVSHSPVLEGRIDASLSYRQLCEAALSQSDNAAANLVVDYLGGPMAITGFMRSIGDTQFSLDRLEPEMNLSDPERTIDASTPLAMIASLQLLLEGNGLSEAGRTTLTGWLKNNQVSDELLRASLPYGWTIADRSGAGRTHTRSIIAMISPPGRPSYFVAIYLDNANSDLAARSAVVAEIGASVLAVLTQLE
ncbi:class A beta-lactamase [Pelagibacterium sp.]|uniref:class A beta-lactamase n=1 Tax=Pelagibacterium sp. TaxID=1967288 RepID=UPI003A9507C9